MACPGLLVSLTYPGLLVYLASPGLLVSVECPGWLVFVTCPGLLVSIMSCFVSLCNMFTCSSLSGTCYILFSKSMCQVLMC